MVLRAILARRLYYNSVYLHNWWNYISKLERGVCKVKQTKKKKRFNEDFVAAGAHTDEIRRRLLIFKS